MSPRRIFGSVLDLTGVAWLIAAFWWEGYTLPCVATGIILIITGEIIAYTPNTLRPRNTGTPANSPEYHLTEKDQTND